VPEADSAEPYQIAAGDAEESAQTCRDLDRLAVILGVGVDGLGRRQRIAKAGLGGAVLGAATGAKGRRDGDGDQIAMIRTTTISSISTRRRPYLTKLMMLKSGR
jgi:hypothetical protein